MKDECQRMKVNEFFILHPFAVLISIASCAERLAGVRLVGLKINFIDQLERFLTP